MKTYKIVYTLNADLKRGFIEVEAEDKKAAIDLRECAKYRHREKYRTAQAKYRAANPEKIKAEKAAYYAANSEKVKAASAKYYAANREKVKAEKAAYYVENSEKLKAYKATYRAAKKAKAEATGDNQGQGKDSCKNGQ